MSKSGWTFWAVALALWGLFSCWHYGYQAGYADGHETAWRMYEPFSPPNQYAVQSSSTESSEWDNRIRGR